jgi:hypothetical protein
MSDGTASITFKSHGVTFDGISLLDAKEVQEALQNIHSNFEAQANEIIQERDSLAVEIEQLKKQAYEIKDDQLAESAFRDWVSVDEALPDELQEVLSYSAYEGVYKSIYRAGAFKKDLVVWEHANVSKWMQVPQPPSN